jgi:hypothetical protein
VGRALRHREGVSTVRGWAVEPRRMSQDRRVPRVLWLSLSLSAALVASTWAGAPQLGGALPTPLPLFPPDNWWNLDVSSAPVDPGSAAFIGFIGGDHLHPDFGGTYGPGGVNVYGLPYIVVDASQPKRTVTFAYVDESDAVGYPIPDEAITQPHWIEHGEPGNALVSGVDRHMLIVDRDDKYLYELYNVFWDGTKWTAVSGAFFDMKTNARRPEGWTSADAAGLAVLPGLVRYDEVYGADEIQHAFRFTVRATNGYVYPASHRAGSTPGALPMGARLRLKAGKDISGFPAEMQKIFRAMKRYGLVVADNGSDMYVSGTFDTRWDNDVLNPAFAGLTANDFEVVELGWNPPTVAPTGPTDFHTLPPCRLLDTRLPEGPAGGPAVPAAGQRVVVAAGRCGIPAGAKAVSLNVTAVAPAVPGSLGFFPGLSAVSFARGRTCANNAVVALASSGSGTFTLWNSSKASVHVVIDVNGYFE